MIAKVTIIVNSDDVLDQAMDDHSATDSKTLLGHSGAVYSTSFSPDKNYMVSSSEDGTGNILLLHAGFPQIWKT